MSNLFIVYGSETKLLQGILNTQASQFIRIYHNRIPQAQANAIDVNNFDAFKLALDKQVADNNVERIIFIGAAFLVQNNLFISEKWCEIEDMIETNVSSYVKYSHYLLPYMLKIRSGNFIYLSSFRANVLGRGTSVYSASKAFGEKFFEGIGKEYGNCGIYSASIRLGCFDGRMFDALGEDQKNKWILSIGNRRLGTADDLVKTIHFVLGNEYTNGGVIELTGGISF